MPVDNPSSEYTRYVDKWARARDTFDGEDRVKAEGEKYLPQLSGSILDTAPGSTYDNYKKRATFFNNVMPTVVALTGAVFLKPVKYDGINDTTQNDMKDITRSGVTFDQFAKDMVGQVVSPGRFGVLVDMPREGTAEQRPYFIAYRAEEIINWRTAFINGEHVPVLIVLRETADKVEDEFTAEPEIRYRVLRLGKVAADGDNPEGLAYTSQLYTRGEKVGDRYDWIPGEVVAPTRRGKRLPFIPFVVVGPEGTTWGISDPPLMALIDMNLSHYLTMADLEWALHWTAIPTPVVTGTDDESPIHIGAATALKLSDPNAKAFYMEFSGAGISTLRETENAKREMMASLGARMLERGQAPATATEVRLRHAGEHASLTSISQACSQALTRAVQWYVWWQDLSTELDAKIQITLNQDFIAMDVSAQDLQAAMLAWQAGSISFKALFDRLQRGGFYAEGTTLEDEEERVAGEAEDRMKKAMDIAKSRADATGDDPPEDDNDDIEDDDEL